MRLRVAQDTGGETLRDHVHRFTLLEAHVYTDEYDSYNSIHRRRSTVTHGQKEWAHDDDGSREVHTNSAEGMWMGWRNFPRPFRGVHKDYLAGYVAIYEFRVNLKRISPDFIANLVARYSLL